MKTRILTLVTALTLAPFITTTAISQAYSDGERDNPYKKMSDIEKLSQKIFTSNKGNFNDKTESAYVSAKVYRQLKKNNRWKKLKGIKNMKIFAEKKYGTSIAKHVVIKCKFKKKNGKYNIALTISDDKAYKIWNNSSADRIYKTPEGYKYKVDKDGVRIYRMWDNQVDKYVWRRADDIYWYGHKVLYRWNDNGERWEPYIEWDSAKGLSVGEHTLSVQEIDKAKKGPEYYTYTDGNKYEVQMNESRLKYIHLPNDTNYYIPTKKDWNCGFCDYEPSAKQKELDRLPRHTDKVGEIELVYVIDKDGKKWYAESDHYRGIIPITDLDSVKLTCRSWRLEEDFYPCSGWLFDLEYTRKIIESVKARIDKYEKIFKCSANDFEKAAIIAAWVDDHMDYTNLQEEIGLGDLLEGTAYGDCTCFATLNEDIAVFFNLDVSDCIGGRHIWNILTVDGVKYKYDGTDGGKEGMRFEEIRHGNYAGYNIKEFGGKMPTMDILDFYGGIKEYAFQNYSWKYGERDIYVKDLYYLCVKSYWTTNKAKEVGVLYNNFDNYSDMYCLSDYDPEIQMLPKISDTEILDYRNKLSQEGDFENEIIEQLIEELEQEGMYPMDGELRYIFEQIKRINKTVTKEDLKKEYIRTQDDEYKDKKKEELEKKKQKIEETKKMLEELDRNY